MIINILLLVVGFVLLIKGADVFVDGSSSLALNYKIPKMVIALTIVAFGTSAPELAVSMKAIMSGSSEMVLGNVVGSNILNVLLILGLSSIFAPMTLKSNTQKKEIPFTILFSTILMFLAFDNMFDPSVKNVISRTDGFVILLVFSVFIYYLISAMKNNNEKQEDAPYGKLKSLGFIVIGITGIIIGSNFVVDNASAIASALNISEKMISLTVVALGTSLPELVTSVQAARKNETDIAIGNIIGSNIFNIGFVIGFPVAFINKINVGRFNYVDMFAMIGAVILLFLLTLKNKKLDKKEGIIMLLVFTVYYSYVILGGL